jgi:hypothetical protein
MKFYQFVQKRHEKKIRLLQPQLKKHLEGTIVEGVLLVLLNMMSLMFLIDKAYRRNIKGFKAKYNFRSADNAISVSCAFNGRRMKVSKDLRDEANVTVCFRDEDSFTAFLTGGDPDILNYMLENKLSYEGNLNYVMKFAYMSLHLVHCLIKE